jgi:hypothetical protein
MSFVPAGDIQPGPIRHEELPPALRLRIKLVNRVLYEVEPQPLQDAIENFQRDANPELEISEMERIAVAYLEYCTGRALTPAQKSDAFSVLIGLSVGSPSIPSDVALSGTDIRDLKILFRTAVPTTGAVDTPPPWPRR